MSFNKRNSPYRFFAAVLTGALLAASVSVFATTIGSDVSSTATVSVGTDLTVASGARVGTGSTPDHITALADGSFYAQGQSEQDGIAWYDASLRASSTLLVTGNALFYGNLTFGDAAADTVTINASSITLGSVGSTTIPSSSAVSWAFATSSARTDMLHFDTANTFVGIGTSSPAAALDIGGDGSLAVTAATGTVTSTIRVTSRGTSRGGCIEVGLAGGGTGYFYATTTGVAMVLYAGTCR